VWPAAGAVRATARGMALSALPRALRFAVSATLSALLVGACATGTKVTDDGSGGAGGGSNPDPAGTEVCRLHSCDTNSECGGCTEGKTTCLTAEHRCVACDPGGTGCAEGEYCSQFGACVPTGQTCDLDANGKPMISCGASLDCAACDSLHQVCDTASGSCVTCTDQDTSACATSACNSHRCAECSAAVACPAGNTCAPAGTCEPDCGPNGPMPCDTTGSNGVGGSSGVGGGSDGVGGGAPGACHDVCASGDALDKGCDPCAATLCAADDFCCTTTWDEQCVSEVSQYCGTTCDPIAGAGGGSGGVGGADGSGGGGSVGSGGGTCAHDVCMAGPALIPFCSDCALAVCSSDAFCCVLTWDAQCVAEVAQLCPSGC
jgi:hypothetical protein